MAILGLNLSNVQAQTSDYSPLPPGDYSVRVTDTELKTAKSGNSYLAVTLTVEGGSLNGRKVFENFVLNNDVGQKRLKSLAVAGCHPHPDMINDSEELHGLRLSIRVKVEDDGGGYGPKNKITGFKKIEGLNTPAKAPAVPAVPAPTSPFPATQQNSPMAAMDKAPWE